MQNYFDYSWYIEKSSYGWSSVGNISAGTHYHTNYGSIPYHIVDYNSSSYVYNTLTSYDPLPTSGITANSYDDHTRMHYLYVNGTNASYDDDYVYKLMRLKPNTTYTISVYGKKSSATVAPWHFVIHDGRDNVYNWADAIKSPDIELDQSTYLNRYTFTFTTDASAGSQLARVGIHPPANTLASNSYFWGIQLQEGAQATTYIYNYDQDTNRNWINETVDGVTYGYSSYGDLKLELYNENAQNTDFIVFIDAANVWGVDYDSSIDDSNKIRSSVGLAANWFTPIGPLTFSFAHPISKESTDKTEGFRFNLGTSF